MSEELYTQQKEDFKDKLKVDAEYQPPFNIDPFSLTAYQFQQRHLNTDGLITTEKLVSLFGDILLQMYSKIMDIMQTSTT